MELGRELHASLTLFQSLPFNDADPAHPIGLGALICLEHRRTHQWYFLAARNGGLEVSLDAHTITLVTPHSPLGRQLINRRLGETIQLPSRSGSASHRIAEIR